MSIGDLFIQLPYASTLNVALLIFACIGFSVTAHWSWQRLQTHPKRQRAVLLGNGLVWLILVLLLSDIRWQTSKQQTVVLHTTNANQVDNELLQAATSQARLQGISTEGEHWLHGIDRASHVVLVGDGLNLRQWRQVQQATEWQSKRFTHIPSQQIPGIYNARWQSRVSLGESVRLSFVLETGSDDSLFQVELLDPTGAVIQQQLVHDHEIVQMQWQPQSLGNWLYELRVLADRQGRTTIASEQIAVAVLAPEPLRALIVQSAPSFDTRHLQNYLVDSGAQVKVITQISKNSTRIQQFNQTLPSIPIERIQLPENLALYDVALIDWRAFSALSQAQLEKLRDAIKSGLGLHIGVTIEALGSNAWQDVPAYETEILQPMREDYSAVLPIWQSQRAAEPMTHVPIRLPTKNTIIAVRATTGEPLVVKRPWFNGQVALSLLPTTYVMQTSGETERYSDYWANLLGGLARPSDNKQIMVDFENAIKIVNEPFKACIYDSAELVQLSIGAADGKTTMFALVPDILEPDLQCGIGWAESAGWHNLSLSSSDRVEDSTAYPMYVYSESAWAASKQYSALTATAQIAELTAEVILPASANYQPVSKGWLWALWLLVASALWLERKRF
ncbi:hypothetical protein [Alteromonas flava]|uniref:hypothetical protein n=1 Tax=Alteromonas flava TaxID=2048003 RepID=UPI000C28E2F6|nr:hypothetical protein [Alteromonas flava]